MVVRICKNSVRNCKNSVLKIWQPWLARSLNTKHSLLTQPPLDTNWALSFHHSSRSLRSFPFSLFLPSNLVLRYSLSNVFSSFSTASALSPVSEARNLEFSFASSTSQDYDPGFRKLLEGERRLTYEKGDGGYGSPKEGTSYFPVWKAITLWCEVCVLYVGRVNGNIFSTYSIFPTWGYILT